MKRSFLTLVIALFFPTGNLHCQLQQVVASGGSYNSIPGQYSISYTIGEMIARTDFSGNYILTNGFQQSEISTGEFKTLNLTLFLEGLYVGNGLMHEAQDESGPHYGYGVADKITVELHSSSNYNTVVFSTPSSVSLSTVGIAKVYNIPASLSGSYYITIKHRNSIKTVSASPVAFSGPVVSYDFTSDATQAFGNNMHLMEPGKAAIWGGDVNQDDLVDSGDMLPVDNSSTAIVMGYVTEDANGDGLVDSGDMLIVDNNSTAIIMAMTP
jgi:hypothetical protein